MKRTTSLIAATLFATATAAAPALAQGNSGNAPGHSGDGPGASASAPGHNKSNGGGGAQNAPGLLKLGDGLFGFGKPESVGRVDAQTTAAVQGKANFGTLISSIRAGKSSIDGVEFDAEITVINAEDLIQGENQVALDNAIADNEDQIEALREELAALESDELTDEEIDRVVAARAEADGSLTVYLD